MVLKSLRSEGVCSRPACPALSTWGPLGAGRTGEQVVVAAVHGSSQAGREGPSVSSAGRAPGPEDAGRDGEGWVRRVAHRA